MTNEEFPSIFEGTINRLNPSSQLKVAASRINAKLVPDHEVPEMAQRKDLQHISETIACRMGCNTSNDIDLPALRYLSTVFWQSLESGEQPLYTAAHCQLF